MGTKAAIATEIEGGRIIGTTCNWDGYPEHVGAALVGHYNSLESALALIKGRAISSISLPDPPGKELVIERYDDGLEPVEFDGPASFQSYFRFESWLYLLRPEKGWICRHQLHREWRSVERAIRDEKNKCEDAKVINENLRLHLAGKFVQEIEMVEEDGNGH